jgi:hypothetical protein
VIKFLALIALLFVTPAWATECETDATVNQVREILLCQQFFNCKVLGITSIKDLPTAVNRLADFPTAADKAAGRTKNDTTTQLNRQLVDSFREAVAVVNTTVTFSVAHAVDYNDNIQRYECELTATFDPQALKKIMHYGIYVGIGNAVTNGDISNTLYALVIELANEDNAPKMNQTLAMLMAYMDSIVDKRFGTPLSLHYSVQQTERGELIQVQNFAAAMR